MWRFKHAPTSAVLNLSRRNDHGGSPERKIKEENRGMCRNEKGMEPGGEERKKINENKNKIRTERARKSRVSYFKSTGFEQVR